MVISKIPTNIRNINMGDDKLQRVKQFFILEQLAMRRFPTKGY